VFDIIIGIIIGIITRTNTVTPASPEDPGPGAGGFPISG
jgi:hypothetical protein